MPVITAPSSNEITIGNTAYLATTYNSSYSYKWYKDGVLIPGQTNYYYSASVTGSYTVSITSNSVSQISLPVVIHASLPSSRFKVSTMSVTCKGSDNGAITITTVQPGNYTATITGNGVNTSIPFTGSTITVQPLAAGTYNVCITLAAQNLQQCYSVVITEPQDIALYAAVDKNTNSVNLSLTGSDLYYIALNGKTYTSTSGFLTLDLAKGKNDISVSTDKPCQGTIEKHITISDDIIAYPNPFTDVLVLNLGDKVVNKGLIQIYNSFGKVVYTQQLVNQSGEVRLDTSGLASTQVYILKLSSDNSEFLNKIMKK